MTNTTTTPATITDLGDDYITATAADGTEFKVRWWAIPAALSFIGAAVTITQEWAHGGYADGATRSTVVNTWAV
jgi:hypothetical protein